MVFLSGAAIRADFLRTPDGSLHNGRFAGIVADRYRFETKAGPLLVPIQGADLNIGASGIPACLYLYAVAEPDCGTFLFAVDHKTVTVGYPRGDGSFAAGRLLAGTVESISVSRPGGLPAVESGIPVRVRTQVQRFEGRWQTIGPDRLQVRTERGGLETLALTQVMRLTFLPPEDSASRPKAEGLPTWTWFVPGAPAFLRGSKISAGFEFGGAVGLGLLSFNEYMLALRISRDAARDPLFRYFGFLGLTDYEERYRSHAVRHGQYLGAALVAFAVHLWEAGRDPPLPPRRPHDDLSVVPARVFVAAALAPRSNAGAESGGEATIAVGWQWRW